MADATTIKTTSSGLKHPTPTLQTYVLLLKPRVMALVVFTAAVGLLIAPGPINPVMAVTSILLIALGGGASGALNMWWDADIDAIMRRTRNRPIPAGRISGRATAIFGSLLSLFSVLALGLVSNWFAAALLAFTIFFYVVIYSMLLKRTTPQNIVIGGAAGALPPMVGWAAATGGIAPQAVFMFALIFMWTPPHFWSLALFMKEDYARAGVPMLTVTHGHTATRRHIWVYACALAVTAMLPVIWGIAGPFYTVAAVGLNARFVYGAWQLNHRDDAAAKADEFAFERRYFRQSLSYLFLHFLALIADRFLSLPFLS